MVNAQEWLDREYPDKKENEIHINEQLEGELNLRGYNKLLRTSISHYVDESKFEIRKGFFWDCKDKKTKETEIIRLVDVRRYFQQKYPTKEIREQEKSLDLIKNYQSNAAN